MLIPNIYLIKKKIIKDITFNLGESIDRMVNKLINTFVDNSNNEKFTKLEEK